MDNACCATSDPRHQQHGKYCRPLNSARLILILNSNLLFRNKHIAGGGRCHFPGVPRSSPEFPAIHDLPADGVKRRYLQVSEANDVDRPQRRAPPDLAGLGWGRLGLEETEIPR